jgi:hypothetical protein
VVMVLLALLALIGPFLSRGRLRAGISLFTVIVVVSLVAPAAAAGYDARYGIPVFGLLTAAATLGAYAIWRFARPRLAPRAARSGAAGRTS